jgi:hypothetical protein
MTRLSEPEEQQVEPEEVSRLAVWIVAVFLILLGVCVGVPLGLAWQ